MSDVMERTDLADRRRDTVSEHQEVIRAIEPAVADHLSLLLPLDRAWQPTDYLPDLEMVSWRDRRLTAVFAVRWSMGDVVRFHTAHKLTLMAHRPEAYQRLGRLVASGKAMARREFQDRYSTEFMNALETIATPRRQANVLQHMLGYFKHALDRESRAELLGLIEDHAIGRVPLVVPLTLFGHHIRRCGVPYLADQVYLRPHPVELMLRNQV